MKPVPVRVEREYGDRLLEAIMYGKPLEPSGTHPSGGWSGYDMLAVAGACLFGAWSHGPLVPQPDLDEQQRIADSEDHVASVTSAVEFLSFAFAKLVDNEWEFGDVLEAVVTGKQVQVKT
jgi:hypothetical protein